MDFNLITITREYNEDAIKSVLLNDDILKVISEDGEPELYIDVHADCYLTLRVEGKIAGVYILEPKSSVEIELHAHILPKYRKEYTRPLSKLVYEFIAEGPYEKVTAEIPEIYGNVIRYSQEFGMVREGINRLSWLKDGKIYDKIRLGITKDEIISFLQELT